EEFELGYQFFQFSGLPTWFITADDDALIWIALDIRTSGGIKNEIIVIMIASKIMLAMISRAIRINKLLKNLVPAKNPNRKCIEYYTPGTQDANLLHAIT